MNVLPRVLVIDVSEGYMEEPINIRLFVKSRANVANLEGDLEREDMIGAVEGRNIGV